MSHTSRTRRLVIQSVLAALVVTGCGIWYRSYANWIAERNAFLESQRAKWMVSEFNDRSYRPSKRALAGSEFSILWLFGESPVKDLDVLVEHGNAGDQEVSRDNVDRLFPEAQKYWYHSTASEAQPSGSSPE